MIASRHHVADAKVPPPSTSCRNTNLRRPITRKTENWSHPHQSRSPLRNPFRYSHQQGDDPENLITVRSERPSSKPKEILHEHRVEKPSSRRRQIQPEGLITVKDIQKKLKIPAQPKTIKGACASAPPSARPRLLERAQEMAKAKVDVLAIDSAHGHSTLVSKP